MPLPAEPSFWPSDLFYESQRTTREENQVVESSEPLELWQPLRAWRQGVQGFFWSVLGAITKASVDVTELSTGRKSLPGISALFGPQNAGLFPAWPPVLVLEMSHRF